MDNDVIETYLESFLPDDAAHQRMKGEACNGINLHLPYSEFIKWNIECIRALSDEDRLWIIGLFKRLKKEMISLMDLESCAVFVADCIYFDTNKKLIISNPR